jgi:outer membrane lipoprotein-sorting protein
MKKIPLLLLLIFILFTTSAQTDLKPISESDLITIKNAIKAKNAEIETLICPFVQTKKMEVLIENVVTNGIMRFQKNNRFRWEYTGENPFVFVQNGDKYYTQVNGKVTEIKDNSARLFQEISKLVISSINGDILENTKKFKTDFQENNNLVVVSLTPTSKSMSNFISNIKLFFSKTTYLVTKIEIYESGNDSTIIQFENVKVNEMIPIRLFELK